MKSIITLFLAFSFNIILGQMIDAEVFSPTCFGDQDGAIDITFMDGVPPYEYVWSTGAITEDITGLGSGFYALTITDSQNQNFIGEWDIMDSEPIEVEIIYEEIFCHPSNGPEQGFMDVQAFGGTEDFSYLWSGPGVEGSTDQFQIYTEAGTYIVTATDTNGCSEEAQVTVEVPDAIVIDATVTDVSCSQGQTELGSIIVEASGGFPPFTYFWNDLVTDPFAQEQYDLEAGDYSVMVTDANGCFVETSYSISGPALLELSATTTDVGCNNGEILFGSIVLNVTGGIPPYNYNWSGENVSPNTASQGDLLSGTYWVTITDSEFCQSAELEVELSNENIQSPNLCLITNDNPNGYNTVYWEDPSDPSAVDHYNIYREGTSAGQFDLIGTVDFSLENEYFDTEANPEQQAYRYYVTAANACGHESGPSAIHKTIHLTINQGSFGNMNLIWDEYDGITYDQIVIYRGSSPETLEEYVTLPGNVFSYTDSDALGSDVYYQIVITTSVNCNTGEEEAQKLVFDLKSNVAGFIVNSVNDVEWLTAIYPNPFEDLITVNLERTANAEIYDCQGSLISRTSLIEGANTISTADLRQGLYIVRIISNGETAVWKAMKMR